MILSISKLVRSFLLVTFISIVEYRRGSFTRQGVLTGFCLCFLITYSNIVFMFVMLTFILSGSFATRFKTEVKQRKINEDDNRTKRIARDHIQVLCNGAIAGLYALGYCWKTNWSGRSIPIGIAHQSSIYSIGFLFTIVCCCGDTLASELGSVLARSNPRMLTNPFRSVPVGINGAVSIAGCLTSLLGGLIVGLSYIVGNMIFCQSDHVMATLRTHFVLVIYCSLFGLLGSLIDSLLGATLQFSGYDRERHMSVQSPGPNIEHISGRNILSNNQVNLFSSFLTSLIAIWILPIILL